ncbi:MAG: response regulator [Lewinellaceae bacterium]|nr:response regulator [Saprospiraceae bacterium]MCB9333504.1 response regulator [Lewinellaceae bacterium]
MRLLIVDDERAIQRLFLQRFRKECRDKLLELHFAFSASEALTFLQQETASDLALILSDINMPNMSGLELLEIVRKKYPRLRIFMLTAYDNADLRQRVLSMGADEYLTKPVDFQLLREKLFG